MDFEHNTAQFCVCFVRDFMLMVCIIGPFKISIIVLDSSSLQRSDRQIMYALLSVFASYK